MFDALLMILTGGLISALFFKFYTIFDQYRLRPEVSFIAPALYCGVVSILFTLGLQWGMSQIYDLASFMYSGHNRSVFVSPFIEEVAKGVATIIAIRLLKSEELLDSLFLAIAVGLGFAFFENLLFASAAGPAGSSIGRMIERSLMIAPMHAIQNFLFILLWLFIGRFVKNKIIVFLLAFPFPGISHAIWNWIALETGANLINLTVMIIVSRSIVYAIRVEKVRLIENALKAPSDDLIMEPTGDEPSRELKIAASEEIYSMVISKLRRH